MRKFSGSWIKVSWVLSLLSPMAFSASFSLSGNYRFGADMFTNLGLVTNRPAGMGRSTSFLEHRLLLHPDIVVDDRFSVRSEVSFLQNTLTGHGGNVDAPENFGTSLDHSSSPLLGTQAFYVRRLYMEWASDWGIFRFGRQPKSWGLGLLFQAGSDPMDDFGTTVDRMGFQAMLGNLGINVGYEKASEGSLNNEGDDAETYELSLEYSNPESLFDVGLLYDRNVRNPNSALRSSHDLSIFSQKRWNRFQLGAEFASIRQDGRTTTSGFLGQADFTPGNWNVGVDLAYASGASDAAFTIHPNYQPFLILFHQSLLALPTSASIRGGSAASSAVGSAIGQGNGNGALLGKANLAYTFDNKTFTAGTDLGFARLARQGSNSSSNLGFEADLHLSQKWYENFSSYYAAGILLPGGAFGPGANLAWGVQIRAALTF